MLEAQVTRKYQGWGSYGSVESQHQVLFASAAKAQRPPIEWQGPEPSPPEQSVELMKNSIAVPETIVQYARMRINIATSIPLKGLCKS
jgi:hypothetical protein